MKMQFFGRRKKIKMKTQFDKKLGLPQNPNGGNAFNLERIDARSSCGLMAQMCLLSEMSSE